MKKNIGREIINYILSILGGVVIGAGVAWILLPVKLSTGGASRSCYNFLLRL